MGRGVWVLAAGLAVVAWACGGENDGTGASPGAGGAAGSGKAGASGAATAGTSGNAGVAGATGGSSGVSGSGGAAGVSGSGGAAGVSGSGGAAGAGSAPCASDADCHQSPFGFVCDPSRGVCGCKTGVECAFKFQGCKKGTSGEVGVCVAGCTFDLTCGSPEAPLCDRDTATCVGCRADTDCTSPEAPRCHPVTRSCAECETSSDCAGRADGPTCDVTNGKCGCSGGASSCSGATGGALCLGGTCGCAVDADCPSGQVCPSSAAGTRQCREACKSDADCVGGPSVMHCNPSSGRCAECIVDAHCTSSGWPQSRCDDFGTCFQCQTSADCADNQRGAACDAAARMCGCVSDADCAGAAAAGSRCIEGRCHCESDGDCAHSELGTTCDLAQWPHGTCACSGPAGCPAGRVCPKPKSWQEQTPTCVVPCAVNADCGKNSLEKVCDPSSGLCTGCVADADCQQAPTGPVCMAGGCGCKVDADCSSAAYGAKCTGQRCSCNDSGDCPSGSACPAKGFGGIRTCFQKCTKNEDCPGNELVCDATSGLCVLCVSDADCTNAARPFCGPAHACLACTSSAQCEASADGRACVGDRCGCYSSADCAAGDVCQSTNGTSGTCRHRCSGDGDCPTGDPNAYLCDATSGLCVQCLSNVHCAAYVSQSGPTICDPTTKRCTLP